MNQLEMAVELLQKYTNPEDLLLNYERAQRFREQLEQLQEKLDELDTRISEMPPPACRVPWPDRLNTDMIITIFRMVGKQDRKALALSCKRLHHIYFREFVTFYNINLDRPMPKLTDYVVVLNPKATIRIG